MEQDKSDSCELTLTATAPRPGARDDTQTVGHPFTITVTQAD